MNTSIIQNITFPLHQALYKRETRKYLLELNETQWYSKEQIKEYQLNKLKKLTEHSFKYSKYYNYLFLVNNINPEELKNFGDFSKIPLLSKEEAIASYDDIICEDVDRRKLIWGTTSGSTGVPFRYAQDRKACDFRDAIELRSRSWWGIKYGDPVFVIWGSRGSFSTISKDRIKYKIENIKAKLYNRYKFSAYDLSPSNMNKWIQEFFRIKPKSIYSYVSSAYFFAQHILNYNVDLSGLGLKIVICTSEPLFKKQRSIISKAFNCQVVNEYGVSESGICAFECSHGSFHIMSENIYLEIIRNGKNIKDGEIGEIVITQLNNFAAPLIRYHTGDLGKIRNKNCTCGRNSQVLDSLNGRIHDVILTNDKRIVHGEYFSHLMDNAIGVKRFQVIQENLSHIRVKIVKAESFDKGSEEFIINRIKSQFGPRTNIKLEYFEKLIPNDNGKFSWIISKLKKDQIMQNISN